MQINRGKKEKTFKTQEMVWCFARISNNMHNILLYDIQISRVD